MVSNAKRDERTEIEDSHVEDSHVKDDLELTDEDADKVGGGDSPTPSTPRFDPYKNFKFHV
jgi:hypothetical protein